MTKKIIGLGTTANDHAGDSLRVAGGKINDNFSEIYSAIGNGTTPALAAVAKSGDYTDLSNRPPTAPALASVPSTLSSAGTTGQISFDANYLYVCIATNTWKRVALNLVTGNADLSAVAQNILPTVDSDGTTGYTLGSAAYKWKELFVSNGSIYIGDIKLSNVAGKLTATKVINPGEENEEDDPEDSDATSEISGGANLGSFKIQGNYLGTQGENNGWGDSPIGIDPGGESYSGIYIPSVSAQQSGASLQIYNNSQDGGPIQLSTYGNTWEFKQDGGLEFPDGTTQTTAYIAQDNVSKFVVVNNSGVIGGSDDGITWNEYTSNLDGLDRVAVGPNKIVYIADSSVEHGNTESLWYADTYDTAPTEVTSLTTRNFVEVKYFKSISKFIALGDDGDGVPTLHYSDDGVTWTASSIDPTYLASISFTDGASFTDIAENELGFLVISSNITLGGFFITNITDAMNGDNNVDLSNLPSSPDEVVWANSFYFTGWHLFTENDEWCFNSESNPTVGTFQTDFITLNSVWENEIGIPGGSLIEFVIGDYAGTSVIMASTDDGQIVYWPTVPAGPYVSIPKPYTATISGWTSSATSAITTTGEAGGLREKFIVTGSSVTGYNGTYYLGDNGAVFTDNSLTTAFDTTGLDPFTGTANIEWSHGQYIDALHYNDGVFYAGNDDEEMFKSTNAGQTWVKVDQLSGGTGEMGGYLNDIDSYISNAGEITFSGVQIRGKAVEGKTGLIKLVPNNTFEGHSFLDNGQFVQVYPTNTFDAPHIHIAAGVGAASEGDIFLGDDNKHLQVNHDGTVSIQTYYTPTNNTYNWSFNTDGTTDFPYLLTDIHNGGEQWGQTLKFGNAGQQVIITGPTPVADENAERIIIQGQKATGTGEGGDVYMWGGDSQFNGGDIKIYAGDADNSESGYGGYVNIDGGRGFNGGGGVSINGGNSPGGTGGNVSIMSGNGVTGADNGIVTVQVGSYYWQFDRTGALVIPSGGDIKNSSGNSVLTTVTGQQTYNYDGNNTTLTVTNLNFNLLFCQPANGYTGNAGHTVDLPAAAAGQRLVIINNSTLCTLTVTGAIDFPLLVNPITTAELIYSTEAGVTGWYSLYGTTPAI